MIVNTNNNKTTIPAESNGTVPPVDICIVVMIEPVNKIAHHIIKPTQNLIVVLHNLNGFTSAMHAAGNRNENNDDFTSNRYARMVVKSDNTSHRYFQLRLA